jgi:nitrogen fixation-related uncharacterized protein
MIALVFFIAGFVALGLIGRAAMLWGVDSREDSPDPRRPDYPVGIE